MESKVPKTPPSTSEIVHLASHRALPQTAEMNTMAAKLAASMIPQVESPLVAAFTNINPFLSLIKNAQENISRIAESMISIAEPMRQIAKSVTTIVEQYQETMKQIRETIIRLLQPFSFSALTQMGRNFANIVLLAPYLFRRHWLQRARDGDNEAILSLPDLYKRAFYRFCYFHGHQRQSKFARQEFAQLILEASYKAETKKPINEHNLLESLISFFKKLYRILLDYLRKLTRELQQQFASSAEEKECIILLQDKEYLLLPSLSTLTGVGQSTLRRYIRQGLLPAEKHLYISARTGQKNMAWHVPYTTNLVHNIQVLYRKHTVSQRHEQKGLLTRRQVHEQIGIHIDTLRNWERLGKVIPQRIGKQVFYLESQLAELGQIFKENNSPRLRHILAAISQK